MAIVQCIPHSFRNELMRGVHNFASHTFKIALYTDEASLGPTTTVYTQTGEVLGGGYIAGGMTLTVTAPTTKNGVSVVDFDDVMWPAVTFAARGALIYNETSASKAVAVLDFGSTRMSVGQTFTVRFPDPNPSDAILRIT